MKKIKETIKSNKSNILIFIGMLIFSCIICINFIRPHLALDTYCVYSYSSQELILHFLVSNRIFSALVRWIFEIVNMPFYLGMEILTALGIVSLTTAWFILYKFIINLKSKDINISYNILIITISFLVIFNFCTIEGIAFWESGIMCLGILGTIIASCVFNTDKKFSFVKSFIILLLASLCYQGAITIFIPLSLVLLAYKKRDSINKIFGGTIKIGFIYVIVMLINLIGTKTFSNIFNNEVRKMTILSLTDLVNSFVKLTFSMVVNTFGIGTKYWYVLVILVITTLLLVYIIKNKKSKFYIIEYFVLLLACIVIPVLPMLVTPIENQYIEARMAMSFGSSIGLLLLFLILVIEILEKKTYKYFISIITIGMVLLNCSYYIFASSELLATNYLDRNIAKTIIEEINNYQVETGINIENIGLCRDKNVITTYDGLHWLGVLTTRSMGTDWAVLETIELYSGKKYNNIEVPNNYKEDFLQKDWNFFNEEQLIFEGDNLFICVY